MYAKNDPLFLADPLGLATLTYFIIDGTQGGAIAGGQQYWGFGLAIGDTRVIYDPYGSFINSSSNPLGASSASYITWLQSNVTTFGTPDPQKAFNNYYIYDIFSPPSFTVSNLDDTAAREIIRQLNLYGKLQDYYYCLNGPTPVLPSIMLLPRPETAGAATKPVALQPGKLDGWDVPNDTLTCLQAMTPRQRFNRIKAAITQQESSGTCTPTVMQRTGCPGNISNATGWTGTSGAAGSTAASFGQTQYTLVTFLSELQGMAAGPSTKKNATPISDPRLTPAQLAALGFNDPAKNLAINIKLALTRASSLNNAWRVTLNSNYNLVALATDQVTIRAFANATGIGLAQITASNNFTIALDAMTRIVLWNKIMALTNTYRVQSNGATYVAVDGRSYSTAFQLMEVALVDPANPAAGTVLTKLKGYLDQLGLSYLQFNPYMKTNIWNESWNAFMNQAIRSVSAVEALLFGTNGMMMTPERFDWVADAVLYRQIDLYLSKYPNATEQDIAALAAYYHNRGVNAPSIAAAYALGYGASVANIWQQLPCTTMNVKGIVLNDNAPKP